MFRAPALPPAAAVAAVVTVLVVAPPVRAAPATPGEEAAAERGPPRLSCTASLASGRIVVSVLIEDLFEREHLRLVKLGLEGRLAVEATAVRRRRLWFDDRLAETRTGAVLRWDAGQERLVMEARTLRDPNRLELPRLSLWLGDRPPAREALTVEITARLQVVTASSLGKVASWIAGGDAKGRRPGELSKKLVSTLVGDLARETRASCPVR